MTCKPETQLRSAQQCNCLTRSNTRYADFGALTLIYSSRPNREFTRYILPNHAARSPTNILEGTYERRINVEASALRTLRLGTRKDHPGVEWKKLAGLGDILVHDDINLDVEFVWDIVKGKLPLLKQTALKMLE